MEMNIFVGHNMDNTKKFQNITIMFIDKSSFLHKIIQIICRK